MSHRPANATAPLVTAAAIAAAKACTVPFKPPFRGGPALQPDRTFTFTVPGAFASALKSAVDELSERIGQRLEGPSAYDTEQALTHAAAAVGSLRAAVNVQVKTGSRHYA